MTPRLKEMAPPQARSVGMTTADPHPHTEPYDVLALGASAGGYAAVAAVLQALPPDFAVPLSRCATAGPGVAGAN